MKVTSCELLNSNDRYCFSSVCTCVYMCIRVCVSHNHAEGDSAVISILHSGKLRHGEAQNFPQGRFSGKLSGCVAHKPVLKLRCADLTRDDVLKVQVLLRRRGRGLSSVRLTRPGRCCWPVPTAWTAGLADDGVGHPQPLPAFPHLQMTGRN